MLCFIAHASHITFRALSRCCYPKWLTISETQGYCGIQSSITHTHICIHINDGVNHARRQPAHREQLGLGRCLAQGHLANQLAGGRNQTGNLPLLINPLFLLSSAPTWHISTLPLLYFPLRCIGFPMVNNPILFPARWLHRLLLLQGPCHQRWHHVQREGECLDAKLVRLSHPTR